MSAVSGIKASLRHSARPKRTSSAWKYAAKALKRVVPFSLAAFFFPIPCAIYLGCGLADVLRNRPIEPSTLYRYFTGNGILTWLLSPFNLLIDLLTWPHRNRGVYALTDLPDAYQAEIRSLIAAASESNLVEELGRKLGDKKRGMVFFKWYGKNMLAPVQAPAFHRRYRFIRTIGVSVFNKKQSTGLHFGPLRVTLRVLYNINSIHDDNVYIQVGNHRHQWNQNKLFIFDDTLQHQSCNESTDVRYCMFVDILRPSPFPALLSGVLSFVRLVSVRFNFIFYKNWTFIR